MTEEIKKTEEEKLLASVKAAEGGAGGEKTEEKVDERSEEQKLIDDLKKKHSEAEKRAENAERERDSERAQKDSARKEATSAAEKGVLAQEDAVKNKVNAAKSAFETAQKDWDDAYDSGDRARLRAAQEKLNDSQMALRGAEFNEQKFKEWKETAKNVTVSTTASKWTPKEQAWIDKNPKFNTDADFREVVYAADAIARSRGIEVDSDGYFELIEKQLKKEGMREDASPLPEPAKRAEKQASSTAAPVGGSTGSGNASAKKNVFTLTPEMREAAQIAFPAEYKKDPKAAEEKYARYQMQMKQDKK